ncbi:MAG: carboxypeptidase M32 [Magnetospirillum sp. WYHS-4]
MSGTSYEQLEARFRRLNLLGQARSILHWDMATMMPPGAAEARGDQLAEMKAVEHALLVDPRTADLIADASEDPAALQPWQAANLREMRRVWSHATALSEEMVTSLSRAASECETVWRKARADDDFKTVRPYLERLLGLVRRAAEAKSACLGVGLYDALLDEYEPGGRSADIDAVFADLESFLPGFLPRVLERQAAGPSLKPLSGPFPIPRQRDLGVRLMKTLGFDFDHGRLDVSLHPFCGGTPDDVRITTRYNEDDFTSSLMGVLHETGHALYERGLPPVWRGQPVGEARGMAVHESQSLLMEMQVCRSRPFLVFAAPLLREAFGGRGPAWEADNLYRLYTRVRPGFIRVEADEVTYPAHVILRYRLEKDMIEGRMEVRDLPEAWADGMRRLLGIVPPTDREGCLQDIHWYDGAWGYFPTYTLGAMMAAQLFDAAKRADPALETAIAKGDFAPLLAWLRRHVHGKGSSLSSQGLLMEATGRPLDPALYKAHLERRYLAAP